MRALPRVERPIRPTGSPDRSIQSIARDGRGREKAISGNRLTSWAFAEAYGAPDADSAVGAALRWARDRAQEAGTRTVSPGTGDALRLLTAATGARAVVEIGTGTGVSGIHLLSGMRPEGVLTTVDIQPERQQSAREAFRTAGFAGNRARLIPGAARDVLPRLADGGYDLVFYDGDRMECVACLEESLRLLRPGGLLCFAGVFADGRTVDSGIQPAEVLRLRELLRAVREHESLVPALLPTGDGLLCAARR